MQRRPQCCANADREDQAQQLIMFNHLNPEADSVLTAILAPLISCYIIVMTLLAGTLLYWAGKKLAGRLRAWAKRFNFI